MSELSASEEPLFSQEEDLGPDAPPTPPPALTAPMSKTEQPLEESPSRTDPSSFLRSRLPTDTRWQSDSSALREGTWDDGVRLSITTSPPLEEPAAEAALPDGEAMPPPSATSPFHEPNDTGGKRDAWWPRTRAPFAFLGALDATPALPVPGAGADLDAAFASRVGAEVWDFSETEVQPKRAPQSELEPRGGFEIRSEYEPRSELEGGPSELEPSKISDAPLRDDGLHTTEAKAVTRRTAPVHGVSAPDDLPANVPPFLEVGLVESPPSAFEEATVDDAARPKRDGATRRERTAPKTRRARKPQKRDSIETPLLALRALRVCVVAKGEELQKRLRATLGPLVRTLVVVERAGDALAVVQEHALDDLFFVRPNNDARTGQALATLGARLSEGVVVLSDDEDFDGIAGVRARVSPPADDAATVTVIFEALTKRAGTVPAA